MRALLDTCTLAEVRKKDGLPAVNQAGLIAATALRHGLHLMTRNTRDFQATGVLVIDPWS